jgi:mannan endo-1,4-beta-mannosidase
MKLNGTRSWLLAGSLFAASLTCGAEAPLPPVNRDATPEARALLNFIYSISGDHIMTGQHNFPATKDASTQGAARAYNKVPVIFGQDFGFDSPGRKDAYTSRPDMIAEVKRQFAKGSIIALCWHAVPPTADEPVVFQAPRRGRGAAAATNADAGKPPLPASVQGRLTDEQWKDVTTPGTDLYKHWCAQVDVIAGFLKQLQDARIPVLWRPYHEMNGQWFWWGGRRADPEKGIKGTKDLYIQIYDRLVNYHKLNNLIWIWSVDRANPPSLQFAECFPGSQYVDIAALDVYGSDFKQSFYDDLLKLANGKPVTLAEVGPPPTLAVLAQQPKWCWWMTWASDSGNIRHSDAVQALFDDPRSYSLSDPEFIKAFNPTRAACGLPPLTEISWLEGIFDFFSSFV